MWPEERTSYILRHLRAYYLMPDVQISYGTSEEDIIMNAGGQGFFAGKSVDPPFRNFKGVPVLFFSESKARLYEIENGKLLFHADLFAAIFFFLSGYQEVHGPRKNELRFYSSESWQARNNCLQVPLVDIYFEIIAEAIGKFTGQQVYRKEEGLVFLSHDIDKLRSGRTEGVFNALKKLQLSEALRGAVARKDPWDNLLDIADIEEKYKARSTYFFLPDKGRAEGGINADYSISDPAIRQQMHDLLARGWEIGVHGSIGSHRSPDLLTRNLKDTNCEAIGNRFHFLNFSLYHTIAALEQAQIKYDASLGFPDHIGFRFATTRPFKLYNLRKEKVSELLEIPLHVMDTTLQHKKYMNVSPRQALTELQEMLRITQKYGGVLSVLWHNNYFSDLKYPGWRETYESFLNGAEAEVKFVTGREIYERYKQI